VRRNLTLEGDENTHSVPIGQGRAGPMTGDKVFLTEKTFYMDDKQQSWSYIQYIIFCCCREMIPK
jgi:hypothetical protein